MIDDLLHNNSQLRVVWFLASEKPGEQVVVLTFQQINKALLILLREIAKSRPLADIITEEIIPGVDIEGDDALLADFRARADTVYHPTSSCMMGKDPKASVVDSRLRVHGIKGLRVVDASIFPNITSGNTNAPTVMVAEKGSAMILEDARSL